MVFFLLALGVVSSQRRGLGVFALAGLLCLCATFSFSTGLVTWPLLLPVLWVYGYRHLGYSVAWVGLAALAATLYGSGTGSGAKWELLPTFLVPLVAFVGSPLGVQDYELSVLVGAVGLLLLAVNLLVLWWVDGWRPQRMIIWLACAGYSLGAGLGIALGRFGPGKSDWVALNTRYTTPTLLLWCALVAAAVLVMEHLNQSDLIKQRSWPRALLWVNAFAFALAVPLYLQTNLHMAQGPVQDDYFYGHGLAEASPVDLRPYEACIAAYPQQGDESCLQVIFVEEWATPSKIYRMAAYGLGIFRGEAPQNWLGPAYVQGSLVILNTGYAWGNIYVQERGLAGIPERDLIHVAPDAFSDPDLVMLDHPPERQFEQADVHFLLQVAALARAHSQLWLVSAPETAAMADLLGRALQGQGWQAELYPEPGAGEQPNQFLIWRFERPGPG
ncbi:MAG: hypothetical protein HC915_06025 [Anaerolineae bacterium]|nr:hypothetical protein [Anaerolineae bacterium]